MVNALLDARLQALWLGKGPLANILGITGGIFSGLGGGGRRGGMASAPPRRPFAAGGMTFGEEGGTDDMVEALLSPGEFVVNARSTARYRPVLERINAGGIPGFAAGGMIGGAGFAADSGPQGP